MLPRKPVPQASKFASPPYPVTPTEEENESNLRQQYFHSASSPVPASFGSATSGEQRGSFSPKNISQLDLPQSLRVGPDGIPLDKLQERFSDKLSSNKQYLRNDSFGRSPEEENTEHWDTSDLEKSIMSSLRLEPSSNLSLQPDAIPLAPSLASQSSTTFGPTSDDKFLVISQESSLSLTVNDSKYASGNVANNHINTTSLTCTITQSQNQKEPESSKIYELPADITYTATKISSQTKDGLDETQGTILSSLAKLESLNDSVSIDKASKIANSENNTISKEDSSPAQVLPSKNVPPLPPRSQEKRINDSKRSSTIENRKQKTEMYDIKKISMLDINFSNSPKVTPILVQNANGPCPLLALVNALTLTTPPDSNPPLIETLRSREQISLGLLLDAVFDELISGRRSDDTSELPDVTDLYSFLLSLHSGMNVNPCFVPLSLNGSTMKTQSDTLQEQLSEIRPPLTGTFEETREMRLYSTFNIPLIHGWLPQPDSPEYFALSRSAKTFEDAQNMMLSEEALECKSSREGLKSEEQSLLQDISIIKGFLGFNATQLTQYGLSAITKSLAPGSVAIFFRNDHFSTLFRHPKTLKLLQLVTDMGYAKHDEIVWESLVDVTGENSEFFSGDLQLVTNAVTFSCIKQSVTISSPKRPLSSIATKLQNDIPKSRNTEQEDHDLALAFQIQEEQEQDARIQRQQNSNVESREQITSTNNLGNPPEIPPRRSNINLNNHQDLQSESTAPLPPPSYEVAATQQAYVPPVDHHLPAQGSSSQPPNLALPSRASNIRCNKWQKRTDYEYVNGHEKRDRECMIM